MKEILLPLASYNVWANGLLIDTIRLLPEEKTTETIISSFDSLLKTLLHMWDAESIWWQRMKLSEKIIVPSADFNGNITEVIQNLQQLDKQWLEWIQSVQERMFQHEFIYQNAKREQFKQPLYQMLLHLFNHNTYHRGQLVTMLRQLGIEKLPQTDFIVWSRKK
jgi:uncharacterized damage-inducible protein DinB